MNFNPAKDLALSLTSVVLVSSRSIALFLVAVPMTEVL